MRVQKQAFRHNPEVGTIGDCHRTAIACLLDMPRDAVPHFGAAHWEDTRAFHAAFENWLRDRGYSMFHTAFDCSLELVLNWSRTHNPGIYMILSGTSRNDTNHTVVMCNGEIICDPAIDDSGIVGPCNDGMFWVGVLVPAVSCTDRDTDEHWKAVNGNVWSEAAV